MDKIHRNILREKRVELSKDLEPEILLKHMAKVLKPEDEEKIKAQSTRTERVEMLLDILPRRGETAFDCLLEALEIEQRHLADLLRKEGMRYLAELKLHFFRFLLPGMTSLSHSACMISNKKLVS